MPKILYAPNFGAGWSSWNGASIRKLMLTWPPLIEAVERGDKIGSDHPAVLSLVEEAKKVGGDGHVCVLAADDLEIAEVSGPFRIDEYDGSESVIEGTADYISL